MQTAAETSFVRQHQVLRTDTLQMLAVRHGVTVPCLKRVNNLMTDHALHSRTHLFIPGGVRPADHTAGGVQLHYVIPLYRARCFVWQCMLAYKHSKPASQDSKCV